MAGFTRFQSRVVPLLVDNIDTDQIIPARYLKVTDKAGLGDNLFADWRYDADGSPRPDFVLNRPEHRGSQILLAGDNFGCGSSREHAPWALAGFGFRAVISTSFADIFSNNALKNGLLPLTLGAPDHREVVSLLAEDPGAVLDVDLRAQALTLPGGKSMAFPIDSFARTCLLDGVDELGYLLRFIADIEAYEQSPSRG
ncbi:MAG TPA: 3-isopropylmalate dehydratase small subunit [Bacteroidota bacterium]|nr:3-isopropylmalate dehydratase small subunit [Bacteroidota bacterium]